MSAPVFPKSAAPNRWLSASIGGSTLTGSDSAREQLAANASNITLVGGALDDTYIAYDSSTKIVEQAGGGIDTVITWGNSYTLGANVENLTLMGGANSTATGNTGNNILTGNDGNNRIVTGGGNDLLVGSKGADTYVPTKDANSVTWITGFKASGTTIDKIDLRGFGIDGYTGIQSRMTQVGSDLRIDLGNGQQVMLENMTKSQMTAANFQVEASVATMPGMSDLVMTFADEFNALNLYSTWSPDDGWGNRTLIGNREEQLYVDPQYKGLGLNPFSVNNGVLTISAAKAPSSVVPQLDGYKYTSGMLSSDGTFTQQYGYFEIRAQVSDQQGMWPAFWLLPADGSWPPELDIMEAVGKNPYSVSQSIHTETGATKTKATIAPTDLSKGFHTYGMDWTASTITFYLDGQVTAQFATPSDMNKPMYMMVNLAVGGTWPGSPDTTTDWSQANMKVDYIHVYQHGGTPTTPTVPTTPDPVTSTPAPVTEAPPPVTPAPTPAKFNAVISHGFNPLDLSDSFKTTVAGSSSKTYTASDLDIRGIDPNTKVTVTNDDSGDITASVDSAWGSVKNIIIKSDKSGHVTIKNFVDAEVTLGNGDNTVSVTDSKRGSIITGSGNDTISVTAKSDTNDINVMKINAGDGNNTVSFSGPSNAKTTITTGSGADQITVSGQSGSTINAGAGNDRIVIGSTGITSVTGGAGNDIFEITAGAKATITDFVAGQDSLVFKGIAASAVKVSTSGGNTVLDLGNGSAITLTGIQASEEALGLPSHALTAVISNNMNALDLSNSFTTSASEANTSTTYTASQMKLAGMDAKATVTASYDANKNLTVTNKGVWNAVKNIAVDSDSSGGLTVNNFVDTRISLGNGNNTVKVTSAKRGTITTGAGNDQISVTALSNGTTDNVMSIDTGAGNDTVSFSGASNTKTAITTGAGNDQITISGQAGGSVNAGAGNDRIVIGTSGTVTAAGGAGQDVFEFIRGAHATISDFNAAEDSLVIRGGSASTVQVKAGTGSVMVDLGNGSSVTLAGVTVPTNAIHITYA